MNRRQFFATALAAPAFAAPSKPNVIVLLADDLGWADVGFHGSEIRTPNIDRLAREGTQIDRFYSFPVCSPTRSAFMTGRTPMRLGLGYTVIRPWSSYALPVREHTIAESFRAAGYRTAIAGKWHLGHAERRYFPMERGFDRQYGHFNGAIDYFTHVRDGGLDWNRDGKTVEEPGYSTDLIGAEAVRMITQRDKAKPLFLYVPFNAPHSPMQAPKELVDRYAARTDKTRRTFAAMVDSMDTAIGGILDAIEKEGMTKDTIVFFFSDNGGPVNFGATNTPLRGAKATTFEGGIRVPAVMRYPGKVKAGAVLDQVACAIDVFPTLAAAAGVTPRNTLPFDGRNLWPVVSGQKKAFAREDLFFSVEPGRDVYYAVRSGPWKLVVVESGGKRQEMLFRIEEDPNEENDVSAAHPAVVKDLAARIEKWKQSAPANAERHSGVAREGWQTPAKWAEAAR